jgi:ornithine cyclodeaminase
MSTMIRLYSAADVHAALDYPRLGEALADAFARGAATPLRHVHALGGDDRLLLMPAWDDAALGTKLVTVMPGNAARGAATVNALYVLMDRASGEPRALIDGEALTLRRTAAVSALAAQRLARADAQTLLLVGTGKLAPFMGAAHAALLPQLRRVQVWGRRAAAAQTLAQQLRDQGLPATAVDDLETAARTADVICCATTATAPIVHGAWLQEGTHLDLVGGFTPAMREADDAAVARAAIFVDTLAGALAEAGDLVQPLQRGMIGRDAVLAELAQLVRREHPGRTDARQITLFKSVGTALADLAGARLVVKG